MSGPDAGVAWLAGHWQAQAALLDSLDEPAWLVDGQSLCVRHANAAAEAWLGQPREALLGQAAEALLPSLEDAAFWAEVRAGHAGSLRSQLELPRPQGDVGHVSRQISALPGEPGAGAWLVQLHDLSRERAAEREKDEALAELRATLEATADGILVTDLKGGIQAFNRRFARLWSLPDAAMAERDDARVLAWMCQQATQPELLAARLREIGQQWLGSARFTLRLVDGALLDCHTQPQWSRGQPIGRVYSFREINRQRPGATRRDDDPGLDQHTGLPHREAFAGRLAAAVAEARHSGSSLALLCADFEPSRVWGLGDDAPALDLAALSAALRAGVRGGATLARLGGARFGVLLEQAGEAAAEALARRWHEMARAGAPQFQGLEPAVGIAAYPQAGLSAEDLLAGAERALLEAQASGLRLRTHRPDTLPDTERQRRLEAALREGLAEPQFRLLFQPRVAAVSGAVQAVEALVRWRDGAQGELLPAQFLPLLERSGLGPRLDDWVLQQALRHAADWRRAGLSLTLGVNVGAAQLCQPGYARRVQTLLQQADWPAGRLELDLTEAALLRDPAAAQEALRALRSLGVRLVLDDFGSGDSPIALLQRFPIQALKLDRSVVREAQRGTPAGGLLAGLSALGRALGLEVLVEGVETEAQRRQVEALGCEGWQGFLHAPAMDAQRLQTWCKAREQAAA